MTKRKQAVASKRASNNHKPTTVRKRTRSPKAAARAQRNKQAFVRSPKPFHAVAARSTKPPIEVHDDPKEENLNQETPVVDNRARALALETILQVALKDGLSEKMRVNNSKNGSSDVALLISNMHAYQTKLLEVTQANMQFVFELSQKLATSRSPFEFLAVIAEFTGRRIIMVRKHSKELAAFWSVDAFGELSRFHDRLRATHA